MLGMNDAWLLPVIPASAFVALLLLGPYLPRRGDWLAIGSLAAAFVITIFVIADLLDALDHGEFTGVASGMDWIEIDDFEIRLGFLVDQLAVVMLMVVTFVGSMIFIYSTGYMKGDPRYGWFFTVMTLFVTAMLTLVLADNFLLLYAAWEGVGFCSFLLIGFYHERRAAAEAAKKAFITTRIGDVGLLIGIILLWKEAGTFNMREIFEFAHDGGYSKEYLTTAVLFLFAGAVGKSAQFPLHVWLPDAMEGPTPVSALIHAATMVVAGIYLVARAMPLMAEADPIALDVVTAIGLTTVMLSATMGLVATDIKRIVAYSTINSLGLMMVALGAREVTAAMFYLFVHGFFKALLFLGAGSVIHSTERQEVGQLGGLLRKMPITAYTFAIGTLAMAGIFPLSGFWAKDEILHAADAHLNWVVFVTLLVSVFITAVYMTRLYILTFLGQPRDHHAYDHAHESPPVMSVPLLVLGALAAITGFWAFDGVGEALGFPGGIAEFVFFEEAKEFEFPVFEAIVSSIAAVAGILLAGYLWSGAAEPAQRLRQTFRPVHVLWVNRYYMDHAYQWVINNVILVLGGIIAWFDRNVVNDTGVDGSGGLAAFSGFTMKFSQTGKLPNYALGIVVGVIVLAAVFLSVMI
ncbi:MAG TPA: NADH-quinone oxidoreductase subunit L [Dehalococcoidia bacterium]|nr:NADH-quinone oxidoreductase subunit L [Dehalococcoidia bacterium]